MKNFWKKLEKPFFALAPMFDVTDPAFRAMFARYSRPSKHAFVMWTEFVSADGLDSPGQVALIPMLDFTEEERPIVAQIFSARPDKIQQAARLCAELRFDGIDINMGCPDKTILKQGSCGALIKNPTLAIEIIQAAHDGAPDLPISVKTRTGFDYDDTESWCGKLLSADIQAITLHARTVRDLSTPPARYDEITRLVELRDSLGLETIVIANGDVQSLSDGEEVARRTGADGIMVGRGAFGAPWFFSGKDNLSPTEKLVILQEHISLFNQVCQYKNFASMKKHFKSYVNGWDGARELRIALMGTDTAEKALDILRPIVD